MPALSAPQLATLRATINRLIPPDDFPGGWDAGVGDFLARQFSSDLAPFVTAYHDGIDLLDAIARAQTSTAFAWLPAATQDTILQQVEAGAHGERLASFFRLLVEHTMEGFYSDPGNGGNHDAIAWQMIGFEVRG